MKSTDRHYNSSESPKRRNSTTANSSPLTDVYDLQNDEIQLQSNSSDLDLQNDPDTKSSNRKSDPSFEKNSNNHKNYKKSKFSTSSQNSNSHHFNDRQDSIVSEDERVGRYRRYSAATDSGGGTPLEHEEGITLPDRKRPVPYSTINAQDRSGRTLIFKYASRGDVSTSESLLRAGASLRIADHAGWTPLHEACLEGHYEIVQLMLDYDADVDAPGGDGDTPLHDAVGNGHYDVVELLLRRGATLDTVNDNNETPIEFAIEKAEEAKKKARKKSYDHKVTEEQRDAEKIVSLLKEWKEMTKKVTERDSSGQTLLHLASNKGDFEKVKKLLEFGADINASDGSGWTALHNAALHGHSRIVEVLLEHGAYVDPLGLDDETPLHDAVSNGHVDSTSILLQYGAEPFRKNSRGLMAINMIPDQHKLDLETLLNYPLDHWQPVKTPKFYGKLLSGNRKNSNTESLQKDRSQKAEVSTQQPSSTQPTRTFSWGGLDNKQGQFESSREEKKFNALLKTIEKTQKTPQESSSTYQNRREQHISDPIKEFSYQGSAVHKSSPQNRSGSVDLSNSEKQQKTFRDTHVAKKRTISQTEATPVKRPKVERAESESKLENRKGIRKDSVNIKKETTPVGNGHKSKDIFQDVGFFPNLNKKIIPKETPKPSATKIRASSSVTPNTTQTPTSTIPPEKTDDIPKSRVKKRFAISGYQRAGENNNSDEPSSSTIVSIDTKPINPQDTNESPTSMTKTSHNGDETSPTKQVEVKMNPSNMQDSTKPTQDKANVLKTGENSSNVDKPGGEKPLVKEEINRSDSVSTAEINVSAPKTSLTDNHTQNIIKDVDMVSSPTKSVSDTNFVGSDVITNTQTKPEVRKLPDPIPKKQSEETIRTLPYEALPKILKRQSTNETANNQKDAITRPPKKLHREFDNKAFPVSSSIRPKEREPNRVPVASSVPKKESSSSATSESIISFNAKHCLPLCAFHRPISSANLYFDPYPAKKESKWGIKPKPNHAKVFLDLQLALCLGMKSGYELIKTYPNLNRRVATHAEKIALEKTIVSQRLLGTMKTILDHAWIKTTVVNGIDCLRLSDIDLHIIYWDPTLYEVLRIHFKDISKNVSNLPPYWILQDLPWPNVQEQSHETNSEQSHTSRPEVYVHKKLRYKLGQ